MDNPDKTKLLLFGTRLMPNKIPDSFHVTLLGKEISPVPLARDLGVEICLTYDEHSTSVVSKCIASLCQINCVKHILDKQTLITVINAFFSSRLYYRSSAWSNTSKKNNVKLQNVQNFATRIITDTRKYDHITPAIRQLNWLPVCCMLQLRDDVMTFKFLNVLAPPYLCDRFTMRSQVHYCNTRNMNMLQISHCSSTAGHRSFYTERWSFGICCRTTLRVLSL